MDGLLRQSQQRTLSASTEAIAKVFSQQPMLLYPQGDIETIADQPLPPLYFPTLDAPVWIDGYEEGWESLTRIAVKNTDDSSKETHYRCGFYNGKLHFFIEVTDNDVVYNNPSKSPVANGDRLVLITGSGKEYIFNTAAPGKVMAKTLDSKGNSVSEVAINAYWQDSSKGYNLEFSIPAALTAGRLTFYLIDQNHTGAFRYGPHTLSDSTSPPWYITQPQQLAEQLSIFAQSGQRHTIINPFLLTLAEQGSISITHNESQNWLAKKLSRALLNSQTSKLPLFTADHHQLKRAEVAKALSGIHASAWYTDPSRDNYQILSSAAPITYSSNGGTLIIGAVVTEQSSEQLATLTDSAFSRLLLLTMGAVFFVTCVLLGYASWLSWRIRQLSIAASGIVSDEGKVISALPQTRAADEIGDLARHYSQLLTRIGDYTDYLQTLSRKLSHELRTPLAIIHSSLDNLHNQSMSNQSHVYQRRAKEGATRLGTILNAMSEASRVEASIDNTDMETVDIEALLDSVTRAYQDIYPNLNMSFTRAPTGSAPLVITAAPDLLVQMLDKLVDNAASFCPENGCIDLVLSSNPDNIAITISNDGPPLPEKMREQLFDNMVSMRSAEDDTTHLGLGLHIVNLIVKFHKGHISADNLQEGNGVIFTITLPAN